MNICKISTESPITPEDSKQARFELEDSGEIKSDVNTISPDISPELNAQNQAQNNGFGNTDDTGDIKHTSSSLSSPFIYKIGHSDTWACKNCNQRGDKWFMQKHPCRGKIW
jgi:hypothetical protein